jgi:putative transposase
MSETRDNCSVFRQFKRHNRHTIRLKGYDYSSNGAYFITICAQNRECLFGDIIDGKMELNDAGRIVESEWMKTNEIRREIELDAFVVMPNHIHGIVTISVGANGHSPLPTRRNGMGKQTISSFVAGFKSTVTKQINEMRQMPGAPVWQRNYYEHIIRDSESLGRIRKYIADNPVKWGYDKNNPGL